MSAPNVQQAVDEIADEFAFLSDWEERYAHLLDMARALPHLPDELRTEAVKVRGCASQVWLVFDNQGDGLIRFRGDSDAHLVRGLIAVLTRIFNNRAPVDILAVDPAALFAKLGFADALTPQRSNGLAAMMQRIRAEASATS